jgi:hypothetical protein
MTIIVEVHTPVQNMYATLPVIGVVSHAGIATSGYTVNTHTKMSVVVRKTQQNVLNFYFWMYL